MSVIEGTTFQCGPLGAGDAEAVLDVYRQCEDFLALGPQPRASAEMVAQDMKLSREQGGTFLGIYLTGGTLAGVFDVIPHDYAGQANQAFIELLMIAAPYRNRGLGAEVIEAFETQVACTHQVRTVRAGVQVNNPAALRFWRKMGYNVVAGPEALPDGTTAYHLQKTLSR